MEQTFSTSAKRGLVSLLAALFACALLVSFAPRAYAVDESFADGKAQAQTIKPGGTYTGTFKSHSDNIHDLDTPWFKFATSSGDVVYYMEVTSFFGNGDNIGVYRFDANGNWQGWDNSAVWDANASDTGLVNKSFVSTSSLTRMNLAAKKSTLYLRLVPAWLTEDGKKYQITLEEYPVISEVTKVKASKLTKSSAKVSWKRQANATRYQVKYRVKGGKWKTKSVTKAAVTLKSLAKNKKYQVRVRAYCKGSWNAEAEETGNWGEWSSTTTFKTKKK